MGHLRSLLSMVLLGGSILTTAAETSAPYEVVRGLQRLQDRIAAGDTVAEAAHAKAIERTAKLFAAVPTSAWKEKRNARALIIYLFSGGSAPTIDDVIPNDAVPNDLMPLFAGALAYGLGNDAEARAKLMSIDPRAVPDGIGGHLALVQATLCAQDVPDKAIGLLDIARLLEPGTLVEEAALRKEMSLIGATGDLSKFSLLSRRYLNAFPKSIYADNFRQLVAMTAVQLGSSDADDAGKKLGRLMSGLDVVEQRRLYLLIARSAVIAGRINMAALASSEAGRLARGSPADEARAMTYFGAATIVGERYDLGMKALSTVDVNRLDKGDRALRTSALALAEMIRSPAASEKALDSHVDAQASTLTDGARSLEASDNLLQSLTK